MSWLANAVRVVLRLPLGPVNRVALIFRPKQPFVEWINTCGPVQPVEDLLADVEVYLADSQVEEDLDGWLERYGSLLFKWRLTAWCSDENRWPQNHCLAMFREWFDVEMVDSVVDVAVARFKAEG